MLMPQAYSPSPTASGVTVPLLTGEQWSDERLATREIRLIHIQHLPSSGFALHGGAPYRNARGPSSHAESMPHNDLLRDEALGVSQPLNWRKPSKHPNRQ